MPRPRHRAYVVEYDGKPCQLNKSFHKHGVLIPGLSPPTEFIISRTDSRESATNTRYHVLNLIRRTLHVGRVLADTGMGDGLAHADALRDLHPRKFTYRGVR